MVHKVEAETEMEAGTTQETLRVSRLQEAHDRERERDGES